MLLNIYSERKTVGYIFHQPESSVLLPYVEIRMLHWGSYISSTMLIYMLEDGHRWLKSSQRQDFFSSEPLAVGETWEYWSFLEWLPSSNSGHQTNMMTTHPVCTSRPPVLCVNTDYFCHLDSLNVLYVTFFLLLHWSS